MTRKPKPATPPAAPEGFGSAHLSADEVGTLRRAIEIYRLEVLAAGAACAEALSRGERPPLDVVAIIAELGALDHLRELFGPASAPDRPEARPVYPLSMRGGEC